MKQKGFMAVILSVLVVLLIVGAYSVGKDSGKLIQARRDAIVAHHVAVKHCLELGEEVTNRIIMAVRQRMPLADFEEEFGEVVPIDRSKFPEVREDITHVYTHQRSHTVFFLHFGNGVLLGCDSGHGPDDIQPYLPSIEERMRLSISKK
jgi:hypothetical protein